LGGTAAAVLVEFFSWRSAFWSVLVGAVIVLAVSPTLPSSREPRPPRIDLPGSALSVVAITALVYGFIEAGIDGWGSTRILSTFVLAGLAAAAFVLVELRANHPILDVRLFADRSF